MTLLLVLFGLAFTGLGGWAALDPSSFPAVEFPPFNEHLIHDVAATFLTFGVALLIAARLASWRTPVLAVAAIWNGFHAISHIVDVDRAVTTKAGVTPVVELSVVTVVLALLAWRSSRTS